MEELAAVAGTNGDPLRARNKTGLLDALVSQVNTDGTKVDQLYDKKNGKNNKVILEYISPDGVNLVTDEITNICTDTGTEEVYKYDEVDLTLEVQSDIKKFTWQQMRDLCEDNNSFRAKLFAIMANSITKKMNQMLITPFSAGVGGLLGGNGATNTLYNMIIEHGAGGQQEINTIGIINLNRDLMDTGMTGAPIVVSGGNFYNYTQLKDIACCNNYGADPGMQSDLIYFYDNDMQTVLADPSTSDDPFFVFAPGAAQLLTKPRYQGDFKFVDGTSIRDTFIDPVSGITFDFESERNCDMEWVMKLSLRFDLWQLPLDLFKTGDPRSKINYNWMLQAHKTTV